MFTEEEIHIRKLGDVGGMMRIERKFLITSIAVFVCVAANVPYAYGQSEEPTTLPDFSTQPSNAPITDPCLEKNNPKCQPQITSNSQAPLPSISKGFKIPKGTTNLLFNSYPSIGPRFVDNNSNQDIYVSQATEPEFRAFLQYSVLGLTFAYGIAPEIYKATPTYCHGAWDESMLSPMVRSLDVSVPSAAFSLASPNIINFYTRMGGTASKPTETTLSVGTTSIQSMVKFGYSRQDCLDDGVGNKRCNIANIVEAQQVTLSAIASRDNYIWDISKPIITSGYHVSLNGDSYKPIENCATSFAPSIDGICSPAYEQGSSTAPKSSLCISGKSSRVEKAPGAWIWTCRGINGGANAKCTAPAPL